MSKIDELLKNEKVEWKKLGEVCEFINGYAFKSNLFTSKGSPIIRITNINSGKINFKNLKYFDLNDYPNLNNYKIYPNDIVVAMSGATTGKIGYNYTDKTAYLNQRVGKFIPNRNILDNRFLFHFLFSKEDLIFSLASGTGSQPNLSKFNIEKIEIPIPSLETQEKIVKILDKFTNYVTELQAELQARTNQYQYYRDMLLSEEYLNKILNKLDDFTKKEYELKTVLMEEVAKIKNGKDWKTLGQGNIPVYGSGGKMNIYVDKYSYNKPTVLIPRKGSIENVFYVDEPFWNVDTIFYTEIDDKKIIPKYFYYFIENYDIAKLSTDSTRPSLTQSVLNKVKIYLPPIPIQNKVVEILDKFQSLLADTKGLLPQEIEQRQKQYEYYREKLLTFDTVCDNTHTHTNRYFAILQEVAEFVGIKQSCVVWKKLGDIGKFENGTGMPKSMFDEKGQVGAIHYGHIYTKYNMFVEQPIVKIRETDSLKLKRVHSGDLVIAKTSENIDDIMKTVAYIGRNDVVTGGHAAIFRHSENAKYLSYVFNGAHYTIKQKDKLARGVKVIELSTTDMEKIKIPIPSLPVQEYIVSILDKFDALVNDISQGLPQEIELRQKQYEYYREKLLSFERNEFAR